jgi:putative peptidoglycan lipid II flippase
MSPAFFAREDTVTPLLAALLGVVLAVAAAFLLGHWYGADGIAAAIALGAWSMALRLIRRGAETFGFSIDAEARRRLPRIVVAALAMGALLWIATRYLPGLASGAHGLVQAVLLMIVIAAGIAAYALFLQVFGVAGWRDAVNAVRAKQAR